MKSNEASLLRGAAAVSEMLEMIGQNDQASVGDHAVAKVLGENEIDIRQFLSFGLTRIADRTMK